jgi:hypothetical protein
MNITPMRGILLLLATPLVHLGCGTPGQTVPVSGTGIHYFTTAIIHSQEPTENGMIQESTEVIDLEGDLTGRVLYQPTSVFDHGAETLVNSGRQVFSGTVLESALVILYDDTFRFDVDLASGATVGDVHFIHPIAGPDISCDLRIEGTGVTEAGDATFSYTGDCRVPE